MAGPVLVALVTLALVAIPILVVGAEPTPSLEQGAAPGIPPQAPSQEHGLGFLPSDPDEHPIALPPVELVSLAELPPAVDLSFASLVEGQPSGDGIPVVGDQGETETCVGWATSYYYKTYQEWLEHRWDLENAGPDYDHIFSVNFVYNQITDDDVGCDDGARVGDALELIVNVGDVPWSIFPWNPNNCSIDPSPSQMSVAPNYVGIDYGAFFISTGPPLGPEQSHDLGPLKQWLAGDDPFVVAFPVYAEFDSASCDVPVMPPSNPGSYRGRHAVAVVGYDDSFGGVGAFKIVNSWGTTWGCSGYAWLSYEFVREYGWEAWWMTSNRPPWIDPAVPYNHFAQIGNYIAIDLTPYENDHEESGTALNWHVEGTDHCLVTGQGSSNDFLSFYPDPADYTGYDEVLLRLVDSEGAEDTQWIRLGWFDFDFSDHLPLALRDYGG
jgi:hypothetical protein